MAKNIPRAEYSYQDLGEVIAIVDLDKGRSVTNDAGVIIAQLAKEFNLSEKRVIYRDTHGIWDEILVQSDCFAGFKSINERELEAALTKITPRSPGVH